jgi:hypothetical protein
MKRPIIILAMILTGCIMFSITAFGFDPPAGPSPVSSANMAPPLNNIKMVPPVNPGVKLISDYMQMNVLAELTGLSQENVKQLLISSPPQAILDAYGVLPEEFGLAMDKETAKLVSQAATSGVISKKQADEIQKKMNRKPAGPCPPKYIK